MYKVAHFRALSASEEACRHFELRQMGARIIRLGARRLGNRFEGSTYFGTDECGKFVMSSLHDPAPGKCQSRPASTLIAVSRFAFFSLATVGLGWCCRGLGRVGVLVVLPASPLFPFLPLFVHTRAAVKWFHFFLHPLHQGLSLGFFGFGYFCA